MQPSTLEETSAVHLWATLTMTKKRIVGQSCWTSQRKLIAICLWLTCYIHLKSAEKANPTAREVLFLSNIQYCAVSMPLVAYQYLNGSV